MDKMNNLNDMAGIWNMLDEMSINNPNEYKKFINGVLTEGKENNMGPPMPHYVVQTKKVPKVIPDFDYYINFCGWVRMGEPTSHENQIKVLTSEFRKETFEKRVVYIIDVMLSESVFEGKHAEVYQQHYIIELVFKYLEEKKLIKLSRKYKIICGKKYMGNQDNLVDFICPTSLKESICSVNSDVKITNKIPQKNNVEPTSKNDVRPPLQNNVELSSNSSNVDEDAIKTRVEDFQHIRELKSKTLKKNLKRDSTYRLKKPKVEMYLEQNNAEFKIFLPNVESVSECDLRVTETNIFLYVEEKYELNLSLPVLIDEEALVAKFIKDEQILCLTAKLLF